VRIGHAQQCSADEVDAEIGQDGPVRRIHFRENWIVGMRQDEEPREVVRIVQTGGTSTTKNGTSSTTASARAVASHIRAAALTVELGC
jgi:hypothetical protein